MDEDEDPLAALDLGAPLASNNRSRTKPLQVARACKRARKDALMNKDGKDTCPNRMASRSNCERILYI